MNPDAGRGVLLTVPLRLADGTELAFTWRETGGPSVVGPPATRGFGAYLAERVVNGQFGGRMTREWSPVGLTVRLWLPLDRLSPAGSPLVAETPRK